MTKSNPNQSLKPKIQWGPLILVLLGLALRLYSLDKESLWYDELLQLDIARNPLGSILPQLPRHTAAPLDYLITHFWILLGHSEGWVRLPAVVIGTLTLPLAYRLGRALLGRAEGLILMALLMLSPFHIRYSQEVRPYAWVVLGVILTVYAYWQLRTSARRRYLSFLLAGVLIFSLSHLFSLANFVPLLVFAGIDFWFSRQRRNAGQGLLALLASGLIALLILLVIGYGSALYYSTREFGKAVAQPEKFSAEADAKPNRGTGPSLDESFFKSQLFSPLGGGDSEPALWLANGLVGLGLLYLLLQKKYKLTLLLGLWIFVPVVVIVSFLIYRGAFFASRYIIFVLPAYLTLLTVGLLALPRWLQCAEPKWVSPLAFLILGGLLTANFSGALTEQIQERQNEDWRLISQFLAQNAQSNDAVIAVNAEATMNWYYPPATVPIDTYDTLAALQTTVGQARRSWVMISFFSNYLGSEVLKMRAWLSEQGAIKLTFDPVIDVYYLGPNTNQPQLLKEIQGMALPVDHALYASLARENRRDPAIARRYYELAITNAPDETTRAEYQKALAELP
jgi:4-amino-4-deoxy-L-arabinose transferase-like glycosyltransferase